MKADDAEDETQAQHQDDDRINLQPRALISVELQHGSCATASSGGARA